MRFDLALAAQSAAAGALGYYFDPLAGLLASFAPIATIVLYPPAARNADPGQGRVIYDYYWCAGAPDEHLLERFIQRYPQHEKALRRFHAEWTAGDLEVEEPRKSSSA
jgi:hypothetical protein